MQWVEKYRPKSLNEITTQYNVVESLKKGIQTKNIPHLIFYGGSGCGKTSTILALSRELFGKEYSNRIIELNASDERGINIVRDKIKMYAKQAVKLSDDIPPWKIIILDEADTMTPDSQFALRRIIEEYSKVTRFCIICNYHNKIIDPIISRCSLFCFKSISDIDIFNKLKEISIKENFNCSDSLINKIIKISRGDLRKGINFLQKCYNAYNEKYNEEILEEISGILPNNIFNELIQNIFNKDIEKIDEQLLNINLEGYSLVNQILLFHDYIINSNLTNQQKSQIILKISDVDQNLIKGCDEYIQFIRLVYYIVSII
uniref:AAA+ ATPase domain-containing protein n=1 Tax=viral metagenome TaxID=1070528 RepID=A0A6C0D9E0_9ZZZZ